MTMWGGRFTGSPDPGFHAFQRSFSFDCRLLPYELRVDRAWARELGRIGVLSAEEVSQIMDSLARLEQEIERTPALLDDAEVEDLHDFVEKWLIQELGPLGGKLHTGRSRNELIATDVRLFVKEAAGETSAALHELLRALAGLAEKYPRAVMPGYTHWQRAQPILFAHFVLAHAAAFLRDLERVREAARAADTMPLGSGALAGCAFPVNRQALAAELGFADISLNSLDAVGDRDFVLHYLFAVSVIGLHLSRLAEDMVLFATSEFGFIRLPDAFTTGSSLMPQKRNPDGWEMIRGKAGRIVAALVGEEIMLKGLATSYQRDLQEDKEPLFAAHDQLQAMLAVAARMLAATEVNETRMAQAAADPALLATELADFLVRRGVSFREAHRIVGELVQDAEKAGATLSSLPAERFRARAGLTGDDVAKVLQLESALSARNIHGGTGPEAVAQALARIRSAVGPPEAKP